MKHRVTEEFVILISVLKWFVFSTLIGIIVGFSTTFFLKVLNLSINFGENYSYFYFLIPLAFLSSTLFIRMAPDAKGHGTEKVIEAIHKSSGRIKKAVVPIKAIATIITIATGGSVGKEGPCAQIGAGMSSFFADIFKFNDEDRKRLVICGISAGFASVFGTPVAGAIFGVEVLFVGDILYEVLLPSFVAGITSFQISSHLGITYFRHPINFMPVFSEIFFLKIIAAGILFGICSFILIEILKYGEKISKKFDKFGIYKPLLAGLVIVIFTFVISKQFLGLGLNTIENSLKGGQIVWYAFLMKMLFTSITLNFGGSGGIVTPIFFIGATFGNLIGPMLGLDPGTCSSIGLVALLAGATNTPIASSIMAVELFGSAIAPYAAIACVVSFLITGHRSVYPSQIIGFRKSRSIDFELGREIENVETNIRLRESRILRVILKFNRNLKRKFTKSRK